MAKQVNAKELITVARLRKTELIAAAHGMLTDIPNDGSIGGLRHGIFANQLLDSEERRVFYALIECFYADYDLNSSADFMEVELAVLYFLQVMRAIKAQEWETAQRIDVMLRSHLRDLKASKRSREGSEAGKGQTTISQDQWAADLLQKVNTALAAEQAENATTILPE